MWFDFSDSFEPRPDAFFWLCRATLNPYPHWNWICSQYFKYAHHRDRHHTFASPCTIPSAFHPSTSLSSSYRPLSLAAQPFNLASDPHFHSTCSCTRTEGEDQTVIHHSDRSQLPLHHRRQILCQHKTPSLAARVPRDTTRPGARRLCQRAPSERGIQSSGSYSLVA